MIISVVIATYNGKKFIEQQLDSILNQSILVDEIIIVDDCSKDNTISVIRDYIKNKKIENIKLITSKKNVGYIKNFYNGLSLANGDLIFLCDQDDIWNKNKIEIISSKMNENSKIQVVNTSFNIIDTNNSIIKLNHGEKNILITEKNIKDKKGFIDFEYIINKNIAPGCTMAITRNVRDMYIKNSNCCIPHDWELNIYGALCDGLFFLNEPLINYRIHNNNTSGLSILKSNNVFGRMINKIKEWEKYSIEQYTRVNQFSKCNYILEKSEFNYYFDLYKKFSECRYKIVEERSIKSYIMEVKIWSKFLRNKIDFRGIIIDLLFVLRVDKILKSKL